MYEHHINEMTEAVMGAFEYAAPVNEDEKKVQDEEREKIRKGIASCWEDKIAVSWSLEDVSSLAESMGVTLTEDEVAEVLHRVLHKFDANDGINWNVIEREIEWIKL